MPLKFEETKEFTFENFSNRGYYEAFLYGTAMDIGGGTITKEEIDILKEYPQLKRISIAGLHQDTFEYFIGNYGAQFEAICFFKNKMVADLSLLGTLEHVQTISYFLNQRAESLWDMHRNKKLKMLNIDDFSRLHTLQGIETAPQLEWFTFGNAVWATSKFDVVPDLQGSSLRKINYNADVPYEGAYQFLKIPELEEFSFRTNIYKTEFLAWISANYPHLQGQSLQPYVLFKDNSGVICGKRKPHISDIHSEKDKKRMEKAAADFEKFKKQFYGMSFEEILAVCQ